MRICLGSLAWAAGLLGLVASADAATVAIDLTTQRIHVESASAGPYDWPISSAREGYVTPTGTFQPVRFAEVYHSKKYDNAPMPHAVFFYYGYAIHGTNKVHHLGPARVPRLRAARAAERDQALQPDEGRRRNDHDHRIATRPAADQCRRQRRRPADRRKLVVGLRAVISACAGHRRAAPRRQEAARRRPGRGTRQSRGTWLTDVAKEPDVRFDRGARRQSVVTTTLTVETVAADAPRSACSTSIVNASIPTYPISGVYLTVPSNVSTVPWPGLTLNA